MSLVMVVRHGHAQGNADHRFIGQTDVPLDPVGHREVGALTARFHHLPIGHIASSDLQRAMDTIRPTAIGHGIGLTADPRLREISNGEWSGLLPSEIATGWPKMWARYQQGEDVLRPDGENWSMVRARAVEAVVDAAGRAELVVISTHGGPALCLALWAAGYPSGGNIFQGPLGAIANTSVTTIELSPGPDPNPRLMSFNDVGHLAGTLPDLKMPYLDP